MRLTDLVEKWMTEGGYISVHDVETGAEIGAIRNKWDVFRRLLTFWKRRVYVYHGPEEVRGA